MVGTRLLRIHPRDDGPIRSGSRCSPSVPDRTVRTRRNPMSTHGPIGRDRETTAPPVGHLRGNVGRGDHRRDRLLGSPINVVSVLDPGKNPDADRPKSESERPALAGRRGDPVQARTTTHAGSATVVNRPGGPPGCDRRPHPRLQRHRRRVRPGRRRRFDPPGRGTHHPRCRALAGGGPARPGSPAAPTRRARRPDRLERSLLLEAVDRVIQQLRRLKVTPGIQSTSTA